MIIEILKFIIYSLIIVLISKYILVKLLRNIGESLNLSSKIVGEISGIATSIPELLTVIFSAFSGLIDASLYNIFSSNIINSIQYGISLKMAENQKYLKSKIIKIDLILALITILIPGLLLIFKLEFTLNIVLLFILLFIVFYRISYRTHKIHGSEFESDELENTETNIKNDSKKGELKSKNKIWLIIKYFIYLILVGIVLFIVGDKLGVVLESLARTFGVSEVIIGIALGFITSIPEMITFSEAQKYHTQNEESKDEWGVIEATNNLLLSNMFNLFIIQSIGVVIFMIMS